MSAKPRKRTKPRTRAKANLETEADKAALTPAEIHFARKLIERALQPRAIPHYTAEERLALAFRVADMSIRQAAAAKKSRASEVARTKYRNDLVNILLRYVIDRKYLKDPTFTPTVMVIKEWLYDLDIVDGRKLVSSEHQVRRAIKAAIKLGPLS